MFAGTTMRRLGSFSDAATTIAALGCLIYSGYLVGSSLMALRSPQAAPSTQPSGAILGIGDRFTAVPEQVFARSRFTLVLVVREECVYCRDSLSFYKTLSSEIKQHAATQMAVVSSDEFTALRRYLLRYAIEPAHVISAAIETAGIRGTPTVALCDDKGRIKRLWIGKLDAEREREVLAEVRAMV
jgi:hypothetical protein